MMFKKVAIIGVGLMGGSLALAVKKKKLARHVIGCGRSRKNLKIALNRKLLDKATTDIAEAVENADLIILCTPVQTLKKQLHEVIHYAPDGALVMDVGSTKEAIVREADRIFPSRLSFVGAHPLCGTENSGAANAIADLYTGALCILTPGKASRGALPHARHFWKSIGMRVGKLDPLFHDRILAASSHLPQLVSYALMRAIVGPGGVTAGEITRFSGKGLGDMTRLALSPAEIWSDIAIENGKNIVPLLKKIAKDLNLLAERITKHQKVNLRQYFEASSRIKQRM
ncbi:MAG: prephenate dehydrogenase/arogenate dehydrogenase family protein [Deltaproteobacteria bacterium]|nr:prephenate dehydrogenase/arogenate dehydrogenase family protein [Deltaproteobacteria bacterium]